MNTTNEKLYSNPASTEQELIRDSALAEEIGIYLKDVLNAGVCYQGNSITLAFPNGQMFSLSVNELK